eukprot:scaffold2340_cov212-Skeletonema_marinoi.AAC.3
MIITPTSHEFAVLADAMKSQGHWLTDDNQLYLQSMLRYLGDTYRSTTGQDEAGWKREWDLVDDSDLENSRRQHNGHDCGIFVITNMTLLAQKVPLTEQTYAEATFLEQNTRECIALLLWSASKIVPALVRLHNKDKGCRRLQ